MTNVLPGVNLTVLFLGCSAGATRTSWKICSSVSWTESLPMVGRSKHDLATGYLLLNTWGFIFTCYTSGVQFYLLKIGFFSGNHTGSSQHPDHSGAKYLHNGANFTSRMISLQTFNVCYTEVVQIVCYRLDLVLSISACMLFPT